MCAKLLYNMVWWDMSLQGNLPIHIYGEIGPSEVLPLGIAAERSVNYFGLSEVRGLP